MSIYSPREELEIKAKTGAFLVLIAIAGFLFSLLFFRLFFLQVYKGDFFHESSQMNRYKKRFLVAPRGLILDRNQEILVGNKSTASLKFNFNLTNNTEQVIKQMSSIINISEKKINKIIDRKKIRYGSYHPITIKASLSLEEIYRLKLLQWEEPSLYVEQTPLRVYPLGANGSQIFGYAGEISKEELQKYNSTDVYPMDIVGKQGLEKIYDQDVKGINGWSYIEVDAFNRISPKIKSSTFSFNNEPQQGNEFVLTIDKGLQKFAYKSMQRKDRIGPRTGSVIVMKTNGEILAWISVPGFDPNLFSLGMTEQNWLEMNQQKDEVSFINKGLQEHYSPGSTLKPFIAIAALAESVIQKDTKIESPRRLKFGNRYFHDHSILGHGLIDIRGALEKSANTFFYQIGHDLGVDNIEKYLKMFGFGKKTGIRLLGEVTGLVPSSNWKEKNIQEPWRVGDTINTSIGQGFSLVTLLQLAVAYNAIATEGFIVKPYLIKEASNKKIKSITLDTLTDRISHDHFLTVKEGLAQVVGGSRGTARFWKSSTTSYGGKTGTSQVVSLDAKDLFKKCRNLEKRYRHHGLFISFAPIQESEIVVAVLTEHSCAGSSGAAPIARDIIDYYMKNKNKKNHNQLSK